MYFEIPVKTNFYNFSQTVNLGGFFYTLRFNYLPRKQSYTLDILSDTDEVLESGLPCVVDTQLNRRIINRMRGCLFFQSQDPTISYADKLTLGTSVRLFWYTPDDEI